MATVNNNTFDYVHQSLNLGSGDLISYYIKAIIIDEHESIFESSATNTVTAQLDILFKESTDEVSPEELKYFLFQNHPNPFNPVTNIKYQIKEKGFVTIKVFDILGKEIVTLVNDYKESGEYSVDLEGFKLPSGIYIYSLKVNEYYEKRKMSLIK